MWLSSRVTGLAETLKLCPGPERCCSVIAYVLVLRGGINIIRLALESAYHSNTAPPTLIGRGRGTFSYVCNVRFVGRKLTETFDS